MLLSPFPQLRLYLSDYVIVLYGLFRRPSCYSCIRVNTLKSTSDNVIEKLLKILRERRQENGSVEKRLEFSGSTECTWPIESISKCPFPGLDYVVFIKGSGPHAIDYGYKEAKLPKEVIVSRKCAEAVLRGAQVSV